MFRSLISDAKAAVGAVVVKYVARASVAVPFLIAFGFGIAALTLLLTERFGATTAYSMMAGGFAVIGGIAALVVTVKEEEQAEADAAAQETPAVATEVAMQVPLALLGALFTSPLGPSSAVGMVKTLTRNLPLVLLLVVLGYLLWPSAEGKAPGTAENADEHPPAEAETRARPNGAEYPTSETAA